MFILFMLIMSAASGFRLNQNHFNGELVKYLHVDVTHVQDAQTFLQTIYMANQVHIYCRRDHKVALGNLFQTNKLQLSFEAPNVNYRQYRAATARAVHQAHLNGQECREGKLLVGRGKQSHIIEMPAYDHACYGIYTDQSYNLTLRQCRFDRERLGLFALGVAIWAAAPMLGESLLCCYCTAGMLGMYLASLCTVAVALLCAGSFQLQSLKPLGSNFKLVLAQQTTFVTLALVAGAWQMVKICQRFRNLWQHQSVRTVHRRLMRFCSYIMIFNAMGNNRYGCICLCLLVSLPKSWRLLKWLLDQCSKQYRSMYPPATRRLLHEHEYNAQSTFETHCAVDKLRQRLRSIAPNWDQVAYLENAKQFARFLSSEGAIDVYRVSRIDTSDREVQTEQSNNSILEPLSSTQTLYRNLQYRTATSRSLQHESG